LDTADPASRAAFLQSHSQLVEGVVALASRIQADRQLTNLIRRKFAIKCTTGYSLNALVRLLALALQLGSAARLA
jgi:D-lactate dehydrogenase